MASSATMTTQLSVQPQEVWPKLMSAVSAIGGNVTRHDPAVGVIEANVSVSLFSWGEKLSISVTPKDGGSSVSVESKSRLPVVLLDWGKNKRNVTKLLEQLNAPRA